MHLSSLNWTNVGWICVGAATLLSLIGVAAIATVPALPGEPNYALRHAVFLVLGIGAAVLVALPHYRHIQRFSYPFMVLVLGLLVFVLVPAVPESIVRPRNGSRRWINLVFIDFQPSELAKISYVLALAAYLRYRSNYRNFIGLVALLALTFIPLGLVLVEPDLGTSLLFLPILFAMLVAAGARLKHIAIIVFLGLAAAPAMYPLLQDHQKDRVNALLAQIKGDPRYEDDIGYQGARAMTLVGSGGWFGNGRHKSAELVRHNRLPEDHNDMVFAVVCCRWGFLGAAAVWFLYGLLSIGGLLAAGLSKDPFGRLVAVGIVAALFAQMVINTGMTIGILPITGITLPFVSYGGTSLIATWIMVGLLLNVGMRRAPYMTRPSFEFDESQDD